MAAHTIAQEASPRGSIRVRIRRASMWPLRRPTTALATLVLLILAGIALGAPLIATHDSGSVGGAILAEPSADHLFGTDRFGRDIFSRTVYGTRTSLVVATVSVLVGIAAGSVLGLIAGYLGGVVDSVIQRVTEALLAIPWLVLALAIVAVAGRSLPVVVASIATILAPGAVRVVRGSVLSIKEEPYVTSAIALGASDLRIMFRHVLPNVMPSILVLASIGMGTAIVVEASLSF